LRGNRNPISAAITPAIIIMTTHSENWRGNPNAEPFDRKLMWKLGERRRIRNMKKALKETKGSYIRCHWLVNWAPPNLILRAWLLDNSLVKRGTSSLCPRVCSEGTAGCDG
jgi:hypothetical protein